MTPDARSCLSERFREVMRLAFAIFGDDALQSGRGDVLPGTRRKPTGPEQLDQAPPHTDCTTVPAGIPLAS